MAVKITFLGAGSSVFVRNVLGDCMLHPELGDLTFALYDIDAQRLEDRRRHRKIRQCGKSAGGS